MNLTVLTMATPKTATAAATFTVTMPVGGGAAITLAENADLVTTLAVLTAHGYTSADAIAAMGRAARGGAVTRADIILN